MKRKSRKNPNCKLSEDDRFAEISTNPLFNEIPRKKKKVVIDQRFQSMFTDNRFKTRKFGKMDKRGRCLDLSNSKHLAALYDMDNTDEDEQDEEISEKNESKDKLRFVISF